MCRLTDEMATDANVLLCKARLFPLIENGPIDEAFQVLCVCNRDQAPSLAHGISAEHAGR